MTFVSNYFIGAECESAVEKIFSVEVVTFDGDSEIVEVMAFDASQAHCLAASLVDNADYSNILFAEAV